MSYQKNAPNWRQDARIDLSPSLCGEHYECVSGFFVVYLGLPQAIVATYFRACNSPRTVVGHLYCMVDNYLAL